MDISFVSWVHNCEDTIEELYKNISEVMEKVSRSYEIILVNDHSSDNSWEIIKRLQKTDPHLKGINLSRHFGHSAGLQAGFDLAKGDMIFTLASSLENHPKEIHKFLAVMEENGLDMVVGNRAQKLKGRKFLQFRSDIANKVISTLVGHEISDVTSPMRLIKRNVLSKTKIYGDQYLFLPALVAMYGAKFGEVEVEHFAPKSKNFQRVRLAVIPTLLDLITIKFLLSMWTPPFRATPIRIFGGVGVASFIVGTIFGAYLVFDKFALGQSIGGRPLVVLSALLIMLGALLLAMGLLGELMVRIYFESPNKLPYHIKETLES